MQETILIIEDNKDNLELLVYMFKQFGHECVIAMDGETGLKIAEKERPALIICDIGLPKLSGYAVAKRIKTTPSLKEIPLIAVTAFSMVGDQEKILSAGFDCYIPKPIEPENFYEKIKPYLKTKETT